MQANHISSPGPIVWLAACVSVDKVISCSDRRMFLLCEGYLSFIAPKHEHKLYSWVHLSGVGLLRATATEACRVEVRAREDCHEWFLKSDVKTSPIHVVFFITIGSCVFGEPCSIWPVCNGLDPNFNVGLRRIIYWGEAGKVGGILVPVFARA